MDHVSVTLVQSNASDDLVAMAAWVSNDRDNEQRLADRDKVAGLLKFLYRNQHHSPFEHGQFTFKADVPLFVAREWQRHRQSYNEVSGRYTVMKSRLYLAPRERPLVQQGKMGNYYFVAGTEEQYGLYLEEKRASAQEDIERYQRLLDAGIAKEVARQELPLSLMTQFYFTTNPRNLMHFLGLRTDSHALWEIRQAAQQIEALFAQQMPLTYNAYKESR